MSLRTDERSWLIYDDDVLGAVFRAMETAALAMAGQQLAKHPMIEFRAIGNVMMRISETRIAESADDPLRQEAMTKMAQAMNMAFGGVPPDKKILDELHAAVFQIDKKANSAGFRGPGLVRAGVRGG